MHSNKGKRGRFGREETTFGQLDKTFRGKRQRENTVAHTGKGKRTVWYRVASKRKKEDVKYTELAETKKEPGERVYRQRNKGRQSHDEKQKDSFKEQTDEKWGTNTYMKVYMASRKRRKKRSFIEIATKESEPAKTVGWKT